MAVPIARVPKSVLGGLALVSAGECLVLGDSISNDSGNATGLSSI